MRDQRYFKYEGRYLLIEKIEDMKNYVILEFTSK